MHTTSKNTSELRQAHAYYLHTRYLCMVLIIKGHGAATARLGPRGCKEKTRHSLHSYTAALPIMFTYVCTPRLLFMQKHRETCTAVAVCLVPRLVPRSINSALGAGTVGIQEAANECRYVPYHTIHLQHRTAHHLQASVYTSVTHHTRGTKKHTHNIIYLDPRYGDRWCFSCRVL